MKRMWLFLLVLMLLLGMSCGSERNDVEESEAQMSADNAIQEVVAKYNAVSDWGREFASGHEGRRAFSTEMENAMKPPDGRPILIYGSVDDLVRKDGKYVVHLKNSSDAAELHFLVECDSEKAKRIMDQRADAGQYVIVAAMQSVGRMHFRVEASISEDREDQVHMELGLEQPEICLAKGRCVDLLFIGKLKHPKSNLPHEE